MQSPFAYSDSYSSYSTSPGGMDFFFYGGQPVYDPLCDLEATTPFPMQEVNPEVYAITSSPYTYTTPPEYPVFNQRVVPQSAPSSCGSSHSSSYSSSFNFPEEISLPQYPTSAYDSGSDSPAPASSFSFKWVSQQLSTTYNSH
jgi:hypothetical protein